MKKAVSYVWSVCAFEWPVKHPIVYHCLQSIFNIAIITASWFSTIYTTFTNFSMKYHLMCKVYTDVDGIK